MDLIAALPNLREFYEVHKDLLALLTAAGGGGVALQRYREGGLSDAITLRLDDGLSWKMGGDSGRTRTEADLTFWKGARASAGRMPPNGFPRDNKFTA